MLIKLISTAAIIVLALVTTASAFDRIAEHDRDFALNVPDWFVIGANVPRQRALAELAAGDVDMANRYALEAVEQGPYSAAAISTLGFVRANLGDAEGSQQAFLVAGSLGWRDRLTQAYLMETAFALGDLEVAALRLDALLRTTQQVPGSDAAIARLEATEAGRAALAARIASNPLWADRFVGAWRAVEGEERLRRADTIQRALLAGAKITPDRIAQATYALFAAGYVDAAQTLWQTKRGSPRAAAAVTNGDFEQPYDESSVSPFDWVFQGKAGVFAQFDSAPVGMTGHALRIEMSRPFREPVARQVTLFEPGRYQLSWRGQNENGSSAAVDLMLRCLETGAAIPLGAWTVDPKDPAAHSAVVTIPANCPRQRLVIVADRAGGFSRQVTWVDDIALRKLR